MAISKLFTGHAVTPPSLRLCHCTGHAVTPQSLGFVTAICLRWPVCGSAAAPGGESFPGRCFHGRDETADGWPSGQQPRIQGGRGGH